MNYEDIKELILKDYIRLNSLATQDIEENNLFMFIKDKRVYLLIMNSMNKHSMLRDRYHYICKFVSRIYPYVDDETLINYLFAFIKEVLELDDIEGYIDSKVEECKLRVGIPMIDEKSIALISSEVRKAKNLMRTIEVMERNITVYKNQVEAITRNGEKRLKELSDESEARVIKIVDDRVRSIITELDQYLIHQSLLQDLN